MHTRQQDGTPHLLSLPFSWWLPWLSVSSMEYIESKNSRPGHGALSFVGYRNLGSAQSRIRVSKFNTKIPAEGGLQGHVKVKQAAVP